jgi:hypothetical protein
VTWFKGTFLKHPTTERSYYNPTVANIAVWLFLAEAQ